LSLTNVTKGVSQKSFTSMTFVIFKIDARSYRILKAPISQRLAPNEADENRTESITQKTPINAYEFD
jgi:hypothetical protein